MNAITFDKDGYVRRLTDAGADERLAIAIASYGEFVDTSQLATKADLKSLSVDIRSEMKTGFSDLRTEMANQRAGLYGSLLAGAIGVAGFNVALVFAVVRLVAPQ